MKPVNSNKMSVDALIQANQHLTLRDKLKLAPCLMIGTTELKFELEDLDEHFQAKAAKEIRETPEVVEQALQKLRELLKG